jgi:hypothetical protein
MTAETWMKRYYTLCDAKDIDASMQYWAPEGTLRFGNAEPAVGEAAIRATCTEMVNSVAALRHRLVNVWEPSDGLVIFEAKVDFIRLDGHEASVSGAAICRVAGECFLEQRTYVDLAPVFAPADSPVRPSRRLTRAAPQLI